MAMMKDKILSAIKANPGQSDREITDLLLGEQVGQQVINQAARALEAQGTIDRRKRQDGKIGNFPVEGEYLSNLAGVSNKPHPAVKKEIPVMSEDEVKQKVKDWLVTDGWKVSVKWGHDRGKDIEAKRGEEKWIIEAKGSGSRNEMRNNYFLVALGEILQRMNDQTTHYSVAFPNLEKFRRLWAELPSLVKKKMAISALFVGTNGVEQVF